MSKKKISREDAVLFAKFLKEAGLDKQADRYNPGWRMDLFDIVKKEKKR